MKCLAILTEYEGTKYVGWQSQPDGRSVQQAIEATIEQSYNAPIIIYGSGRTDAGVHARGQVFHMNVPDNAGEIPIHKIPIALNTRLPRDIRIRAAVEVEPIFHARFSASSREYVYNIAKNHTVFTRQCAWTPHLPYDPSLFAQCIRIFLGKHDFTAISKHNPSTDSYICTLDHCDVEEDTNQYVVRIRADRFVYGMCRSIVGMAMFVARKKITVEDVCSILDSGQRSARAQLAPAHGLILNRVRYTSGIFDAESYY